MSQRTIDLLNRWIAETVHPVPAAEVEREAKRLATEFTAFAADAGLNVENLETDISEDLEAFMADALKAAAGTDTDDLLHDDT